MDDWARCRGYIADALEYTGGTWKERDVFDAILAGTKQFWPGERCAVVTSVDKYPRKTILLFFLAGGDLEEILPMEPGILAWARTLGCQQATIMGRPGWERAMKDWTRAKTVILERELDNG